MVRLKIAKSGDNSWWYNTRIGEEFDIYFKYYLNGQNHELEISNIHDIQKYKDKYGDDLLLFSVVKEEYSIPFRVSPHQIHLENTNYKYLLRKLKLKMIDESLL